MPLQRQLTAALHISSTEPRAFDQDWQETARTFASYAGVAISNTHLYKSTAKLAASRTRPCSRAVIQQAKGILMGQRLCSSQQAFAILVDLSQRSNRKLRVVTEAVAESTTSPHASGPA